MSKPFTPADSAAMVARVHARPEVRALDEAIAALGPLTAHADATQPLPSGASERNRAIGRTAEQRRAVLRAAYREELEAGGWLACRTSASAPEKNVEGGTRCN